MTPAARHGADAAAPSARQVVTYTPSGASEPLRTYLSRLWRYRHFVAGYAWAELRERYLRHRLASLWLVLNPLLLAGTYTFLIVVLRRREDPTNVLAFITAGLFVFFFFRDAIIGSSSSLTSATSLLLASDMPKAALPAAATIEAVLSFGIAMAIYTPIHLATGQPVGLATLQAIPFFLLALVFGIGVALICAFAAAMYRDLVPLLPFALRIALYVSPVLFTVEQIRAALPSTAERVLWLNPFMPFLDAWHQIIGGEAVPGERWAALVAWTIPLLVIGTLVAHRSQHTVAARL